MSRYFPTKPDAAARGRQDFPGGGNVNLNLSAKGGNPDTAHKIVGRPGLKPSSKKG